MTVYSDLNDAPAKHYGVIYLDPAWKFKTYAPPKDGAKGRRDAERHYPTMTLEEMLALPVKRVAAKDCFLIMWTTWAHQDKAEQLIKAYGFKKSSSFKVWVKTKKGFSPTRVFADLSRDFHTGTGFTSRKNTEFCILARRGAPKRLARDVRELLIAPVREHSRKPDEMYGEIERFAAGPYLEMNARTERPGWDQWGNEVGKFDPAPGVPLPPLLEIAKAPVARDLFEDAQ